MSSSGWAGRGDGPHGGPQQHGAAPHGSPSAGQPGAPHGAPSPWQAPPSAPHSSPAGAPPGGHPAAGGPYAPGGPQGPGGPYGPGGPNGSFGGPSGPYGGGPPPRKRPWALLAVAFTCVLALVLVVGGGITYLALRKSGDPGSVATDTPSQTSAESPSPSEEGAPPEDDAPTPERSETSNFEVKAPYDPPTGTADELWDVLAGSPLTEGTLPTLSSCELPETPVDPDQEELQAVLDAASACLNQVWATASSDRGLPWSSPSVVVYKHPDVPKSAVCDSNFSADFPRMCNLDSTIYWPLDYGPGEEAGSAEDAPGAYLWHLAYVYTNTVGWNSSLSIYYGTMSDELDSEDPERSEEAWRRFTLQNQCLASAASMQLPTAAEPTKATRDTLSDPERWSPGEPPREITPENSALWTEKGFAAEGDLSVCNTWVADPEQVA